MSKVYNEKGKEKVFAFKEMITRKTYSFGNSKFDRQNCL